MKTLSRNNSFEFDVSMANWFDSEIMDIFQNDGTTFLQLSLVSCVKGIAVSSVQKQALAIPDERVNQTTTNERRWGSEHKFRWCLDFWIFSARSRRSLRRLP
jgi:hypothetical protein